MKDTNMERPKVRVVSQPETEMQPPDGGWGWVVCFAVFFTNFTVIGMTAINGVLLIEVLELFHESLSKTTIVFSLISGGIMFGGPLVSIALMFKVSHRQIMMVGGITAAASAVASSFAPNVETLMLTYGILVGLSLAVNYFSANVILGCYFLKKRALAIGIASSGIGLGSFTLNYISTKIIPFYTMRGTFILFGGLFLHLTVCGALCRPLKPVIKKILDIPQIKQTSVDKIERTANFDYGTEDENKETQDEKCDGCNQCISENTKPIPLQVEMSITSKTMPVQFRKRISSCCNATTFRNKYFYLLLAIYTVHSVVESMQIYLPLYADEIKLSREQGALIMAIYGIASTTSNLLFGFMVDIIHIPQSFILFAALCSVSLGAMLVPFSQSFETLTSCAVILSIGHNFGTSLRIVLISAILGIEEMTRAYSIVTVASGIMSIIYPILNGFVFEATQQFSVVFYFDSVIAFMGAVLSCGIIYAQKTGKFVE